MAIDTAHPLEIPPQTYVLLSKAAQKLRQLMCGLHGHDSLKHFEQGRISLLCSSCGGTETPGWDLKKVSGPHSTQLSTRAFTGCRSCTSAASPDRRNSRVALLLPEGQASAWPLSLQRES